MADKDFAGGGGGGEEKKKKNLKKFNLGFKKKLQTFIERCGENILNKGSLKEVQLAFDTKLHTCTVQCR